MSETQELRPHPGGAVHAVLGRGAQAAVALLLSAGLAACTEQAGTPPDAAVEVTAVTVEPRDTPVVSEFVGRTVSSRRVEIRARVDGFLEERVYTEGAFVQEGDVLFQMDRKPFEADLRAAQAELAQQQARLATATANLKRVRPLAAENAIPQKELDDADGAYRSARAAVEAAQAKVEQAQLNLGYTTISSPVSGLSSFALQQEGAYIGAGSGGLLTYVAQIDPMWVEFSVSENQLLRGRAEAQRGILVEPADQNYEVEIVLADGRILPQRGQITFADASLSEETGTFLIRAELSNPDQHLRPGQFVQARLKGALRPDAILVPKRAVQQGAQGSFVWVIDDEGSAEFRPVGLGPWHEDEWFIEEGLQGGETVVVDGAIKLRAGASVRIVKPEETEPTAGGAG
jgi:membrane fusion protein (multidrug efflux system)